MRSLAQLTLLLLSVAACKDQPKFIPPQDAGPLCEGNEQLINGECRFVCQRDGDCMAGERCNFFLGQCEAKPPPPDAGPPPGNCTTGAVRCSSDRRSIESCTAEAVWSTTTTCPPPNGFCQNEKCLVCQPGAASCVAGMPTQLAVCLDDGSATRTVNCSGAATCQSNECRECAPNSYRCNPGNGSLQQCQRTSDETATWKWVNAGDNFDGTCITGQCRVGGANGFECVPPACFPGQIQCKDARTAQTCGMTGSWVDSPCAASAECQAGVCVDECSDAVAAKSYFGCDYWTTTLDNSVHAIFKGGVTSGQGATGAPSEFAFVIANRSVNPATVTITRHFSGSLQTLPTVTVPGRNDATTKGVMVVRVPWQSIGAASDNNAVSGRARYAYRLQSTKPLTVYQFNPLGASMVDSSRSCQNVNQCSGATPNPTCVNNRCNFFAYSNDASLLLPAHVLGTSYVTMSADHIVFRASSATSAAEPTPFANGSVTIIATEDNTSVQIRPSARTLAGTTGGVAALARGALSSFTLNSYEVLTVASDNPTDTSAARNLACGTNPFDYSALCLGLGLCSYTCSVDNADLTGSIVTSDKPIAVFGGSACTIFGPANGACDHIEEQQFPFRTWGKDFVAVRSAPLRLTNGQFATPQNAGPDYYKIVAGCPTTSADCPTGTAITLTPPPAAADVLTPGHCLSGSLSANTCRLAGGSYVEFKSKVSFTVSASQPIAVGQFFAGQDATASMAGGIRPDQGDPSFILLPPVQQWRSSYTVLTAPGTRDNYLGLVIDSTKVQSVTVDGTPVPAGGWTSIPNSPFRVVNHAVSNGTHVVGVLPMPNQTTPPGAGVTVYGFDQYVSYGYTGGLDLQTIVTGINPGG